MRQATFNEKHNLILALHINHHMIF